MKRILFLLTFLTASIFGVAQSINLNDVVRANTLSPTRTANALDAAIPYTATGTDTYAVTIMSGTLYSGSATYTSGDKFTITFTNANTVTTPTVNVNTEGAKTIVDNKGNAVAAGDVHGILIVAYDGTNFRIVGAAGGGSGTPGGSDTQVQVNGSGSFAGDPDFTFTGGNTLNVDVAIVDAETYGAGWNGDNSVPTKNDAFDGLAPLAGSRVYSAAASDEITPLAEGDNKLTFRSAYAMTVTGVRASLNVAQSSGSIFTVDIQENGVTILSTLITIDNGEKTSTTAAAPPVISDTAIADDSEITINITQIGNGTARGLKIAIIGY